METFVKFFISLLLLFTLHTPVGLYASTEEEQIEHLDINEVLSNDSYTMGENPAITVLDNGLVVSVQADENHLTYSLGEYNEDSHSMYWTKSFQYGEMITGGNPSSISIDTLPNGDVIQVYEFVDIIFYSLGRYEEGKINWYSMNNYFGMGEHPSLTVMENGHLVLVNEGLNTNALWYGYGTFENDEAWHRNMVHFDKGLEPSVSALDDGKIVVTHKEEVNGNLWSTIGTIDPDKKMVEFESAVRYESQSSNNPVSLQLDNGEILTMFDSNQSNGTWNRMGEVPEGGSSIEWTTNTYHQFEGKKNDIVQLQNGIFLNVHEDHSSNNIRYQLGKYDDDRVDWMASFEEPIPIEWSPPPPPDSNIPFTPVREVPLQILEENNGNITGASDWLTTGENPSITVLNNGLVLMVNDNGGKLEYKLGEYYDFRVYWTQAREYGGGNDLYYSLGRYTDKAIHWYSKDNYYGKGNKPNVAVSEWRDCCG